MFELEVDVVVAVAVALVAPVAVAGICEIAAFRFCSVIFCKKVMTAASLAATIDLS